MCMCMCMRMRIGIIICKLDHHTHVDVHMHVRVHAHVHVHAHRHGNFQAGPSGLWTSTRPGLPHLESDLKPRRWMTITHMWMCICMYVCMHMRTWRATSSHGGGCAGRCLKIWVCVRAGVRRQVPEDMGVCEGKGEGEGDGKGEGG